MKKLNLWTILMALFMAFGMAACSEKDDVGPNETDVPKPPATVADDDWQDVSLSGGTIEKDDISITFPSGTFSSDTKVAITAVNANTVAEEGSLSKCYQITLPSGSTNNRFSVVLQYDGTTDNVDVVARMPGVNRHTAKVSDYNFIMDAEVVGNTVQVSMPLMSSEGNENPYFTIGVFEGTTDADDQETRANGNYHFSVKWMYDIYRKYKNSGNKKKIEDFLETHIPQAHKDIESLKMELPTETIRYIIDESEFVDANIDSWGFEVAPWYSKSEAHILLNARKLNSMVTSGYQEDNVNQIDQTLVHETIHAVQDMVYDPRYACNKSRQGLFGDPWAMLSEAIGSWSECVTGDKRIAENSITDAKAFLSEFMPHYWGDNTYMINGYGMGLFIKYLASQTSDDKIVELFQYQRDGKSFYDALKAFLNKHGLTFFTEKDYYAFALKVLNCEIDSRIDLDRVSSDNFIRTADGNIVNDIVYNYGVKIHKYRLGNGEAFRREVNDKAISISTTTDGTVNSVYCKKGKKLSLLGTVQIDAPYTISVEDFTKLEGGELFVVSTRTKNYDFFNTLVDRLSYVFTVTEETASELELKFSFEEKKKPDNALPGSVFKVQVAPNYLSYWKVRAEHEWKDSGNTYYESVADMDQGHTIDISNTSSAITFNANATSDDGEIKISFDIVDFANGFENSKINNLKLTDNTIGSGTYTFAASNIKCYMTNSTTASYEGPVGTYKMIYTSEVSDGLIIEDATRISDFFYKYIEKPDNRVTIYIFYRK